MIIKLKKEDRKYLFLGTIYILGLEWLLTTCYPSIILKVIENSHGSEYSFTKNLYGLLIAVLMMCIIKDTVLGATKISQYIFVIIEILYFIPGVLWLSITATPLSFLFYFAVFDLLLIISNKFIPLEEGKFVKRLYWEQNQKVTFIIEISIIVLGFISAYLAGANFSNITFSEIYSRRAVYNSLGTHWIITTIFTACMYGLSLVAIHSLQCRKWGLLVLSAICELYIYSAGANRIAIYIYGMAIIITFIKINCYKYFKISICLVILTILGWYFFPQIGMFLVQLVDRLGTIPVKVSMWYFDFIEKFEPEYLKDAFPRVYNIFGVSSPYPTGISRAIGQYFTRTRVNATMNANTGLVGGALGNFGKISIIFSPLTYVLGFRFVGAFCENVKNNIIRWQIALIYALLAMNGNQFLSTFIRPTSNLLLLILIVLLFNEKSNGVEK